MKSLSLLILSLVLFTNLAHAQGDKSGGGGDVIACGGNQRKGIGGFLSRIFDHTKPTYYLLDVYEAKVESDSDGSMRYLNLEGPEQSIEYKINLARKDYAQLDPVRAENYATEALWMAADLQAIENGQVPPYGLATMIPQRIPDIPDSMDLYKFLECPKFQLVRQMKPQIRGPFYTFDSKYWKKLDRDNKVATLYHEVIYKEFRSYGAHVSPPSRKLNSYIFSRTASRIGIDEYLTFLNVNNAKDYIFRTSIGDLVIKNFDFIENLALLESLGETEQLKRLKQLKPPQNNWSASWVRDGKRPSDVYISEVQTQYAGKDWMIPVTDATLMGSINTLVFNKAKQLIGFRGKFAIEYNNATAQIMGFHDSCTDMLESCLETTYISVEQDSTFRAKNETMTLHFDLNNKILE